MFCPKCGQPQSSEAMRFCSRCGLSLGATALLLANDGLLPTHLAAQSGGDSISPRRRGARQGVVLLLVGIFSIPLVFVLHEMIRLPTEAGALGVLAAFVGLLRLLYALVFQSKSPKAQTSAPQTYAPPPQFDAAAQRGALPQGEFRPAQGFSAPRADTTEIAQPPSVTDHTTRLLQDDNTAER